MHWEQSKASCMFKLPCLQEVHQHTLAVDFDMRVAGDWKDAENGRFIRKGMTVLSTSSRMVETSNTRSAMLNMCIRSLRAPKL